MRRLLAMLLKHREALVIDREEILDGFSIKLVCGAHGGEEREIDDPRPDQDHRPMVISRSAPLRVRQRTRHGAVTKPRHHAGQTAGVKRIGVSMGWSTTTLCVMGHAGA